LRVLNTLFQHNVYSGIHEVFKAACNVRNAKAFRIRQARNSEIAEKAGVEYIVCDDCDHKGINIGNSHVIVDFNYLFEGKRLSLQKDDAVITRSIFNTLQPFYFIRSGRKFFISEESWGEKSFKRQFYSTIGKALFRKTPFITQTLKSKNFLESLGFKCIHLPPFIKSDFNLKSGKHILYVARMESIKNPDLVIELAKRMPDQKFVFVAALGKKEIMERIRGEAGKLKNVQFFERVPYAQLLQLYRDAKLLLLPTSADPIGYCVVEALSFATPVITTKYAGTADYLDSDWVMDDFDPENWEMKIREILENEPESRKLAKDLFIKNNLELGGAYFNKMADEIADYLKSNSQKSR